MESLCPSYLYHHFEVKLPGARYWVIFPTLTLAPCAWSVGNKKGFKNLKQKMKIIEHFL